MLVAKIGTSLAPLAQFAIASAAVFSEKTPYRQVNAVKLLIYQRKSPTDRVFDAAAA
jgi:hypothetical protein